MPNDRTAYEQIRDAFIFHVHTLTWKHPEQRFHVAFRPNTHPEGPALATILDDRESVIPDGWELAIAKPIPRDVSDVQRNRWIDEILRGLPILPLARV